MSPSQNDSRPQNLILSALPDEEYQRLAPHLEPVALPQGETLAEQGGPVPWIYFIDSGLTSVVVATAEGHEVEVTMTGAEGIIGSRAVLGDFPNPFRVLMQIGGSGHRLPVKVFKEEFGRGERLQELVLMHLNLLLTDTSQCAMCNRLHTIEKRLCRWLMMACDRLQADELPLTQEYIAMMLGTGRPGVNIASGDLEKAGLISHSRGCIVVLDADLLEKNACECYAVLKEHYEMLVRQLLQNKGS